MPGKIVTVTAPTGLRSEWKFQVGNVIKMIDAYTTDEWMLVVTTTGLASLESCIRYVNLKVAEVNWGLFVTIVGGTAAYIKMHRKPVTVSGDGGTVGA